MKRLGAIFSIALMAGPAWADDDGWPIYVGADTVEATYSVSSPAVLFNGDNQAQFAEANKADTTFIRLRAGTRLTDSISVELHYGLEDETANDANGTVGLDEYYGIYIAPTTTVFDLFEINFPIGFSSTSIDAGDSGTADSDGVAFGMNLEIPLSLYMDLEKFDFSILGGGMLYQQDNDSRFYGYNLGLRFDFKL